MLTFCADGTCALDDARCIYVWCCCRLWQSQSELASQYLMEVCIDTQWYRDEVTGGGELRPITEMSKYSEFGQCRTVSRAVPCYEVKCSAVQCRTVLCCAVPYHVMKCSAVPCRAVCGCEQCWTAASPTPSSSARHTLVRLVGTLQPYTYADTLYTRACRTIHGTVTVAKVKKWIGTKRRWQWCLYGAKRTSLYQSFRKMLPRQSRTSSHLIML